MKAILTSVEYGDLLALTLPYNRHHFEKVVVVTTPQDYETIAVAQENNCIIYATEKFYANGAKFNKWEPLEEGLDILGRDGWICIMDADIAWPKVIPDQVWNEDTLYSPRRYINHHLNIPPEKLWSAFEIHGVSHIWAGYSQIFHASAAGPAPWHMSHHTAGGPDTVFQNKWKKKERLGWKCLHLGPTEMNWEGRITPRVDGTHPNRSVDLNRMMAEHRRNFNRHGG